VWFRHSTGEYSKSESERARRGMAIHQHRH
jgi:hypothetical protein